MNHRCRHSVCERQESCPGTGRRIPLSQTSGWNKDNGVRLDHLQVRADYSARYPELEVLRCLPVGTLVDGELVAFDEGGRPDLHRLLRRQG
jgi:hypothetical protein